MNGGEKQAVTEFKFKEVDQEGLDILDVVAEATRFNKWMYKTIEPHCGGEILEIGSGTGNISRFFLEDSHSISLSDIRDNYCDILRKKFPALDAKKVLKMNLTDEAFDSKFKEQLGKFDTVFALNVVEHIKQDELALANIYKLLKPGGRVIILVPAFQTLYNNFDEALEHYRRYTKQTLETLIGKKFEVIGTQYFNCMGIAGWYVNGNLLKRTIIPKDQMKLYNLVIPISKVIDKLVLNKIGLSVITVGEKK